MTQVTKLWSQILSPKFKTRSSQNCSLNLIWLLTYLVGQCCLAPISLLSCSIFNPLFTGCVVVKCVTWCMLQRWPLRFERLIFYLYLEKLLPLSHESKQWHTQTLGRQTDRHDHYYGFAMLCSWTNKSWASLQKELACSGMWLLFPWNMTGFCDCISLCKLFTNYKLWKSNLHSWSACVYMCIVDHGN